MQGNIILPPILYHLLGPTITNQVLVHVWLYYLVVKMHSNKEDTKYNVNTENKL